MSKQSEAKAKQNYQDKPLSTRCRECEFIESTEIKKDWGGINEKLRCKIGGFKVQANAICDQFKRKN